MGLRGVDPFFVISGYLITTTLFREHVQTGGISLMAFYRRRALRLLPGLAVLCLAFLLYAAFVIHNLSQGCEEVFIVALYVGNWTRAFGVGLPQYLGHTWSLAIEEQFYMLWPVLLLIILAVSSSIASALRLVVALIIAFICWRAVLALQGASADRLYNGTDTRADALTIGAALALALQYAPSRLDQVARYLWLPAVIIIVAVPMLFPWDDERMSLGGFSVVGLAAAAILTAALNVGPVARILSNPAFVWIGQRSYGLYLWHYPIMLVALIHFHIPLGSRLSLIELVSAFVLAAFSYKFIERPFLERRYVKRSMDHAKSTPQISN